eukprot:TRINITY_DN17796_c0_g2_i5.p1 TRINITY_DN17796_c0_g2~~TRINITY_DN17796_c0_g2_i5.p1  ORF type:complete len:506 (+),score=83.99 TRINITY_DN17796_c0_g2_i5:87-1604(+)
MQLVVIGGGIGGVCCVEELCRQDPQTTVTLISASSVLKGVGNVVKLTENLEEFEVVERDLTSMPYPNLKVINARVQTIDVENKTVVLQDGSSVAYDKLCLATGARPKLLSDNENVMTVRDTESVEMLAQRLQGTKRAIVVGNGGIALEVLPAMTNCEVIWVLKHRHIGDAFFDVDAAQFLLDQLNKCQTSQSSNGHPQVPNVIPSPDLSAQAQTDNQQQNGSQRASTSKPEIQTNYGHALGPKWVEGLKRSEEDNPYELKRCDVKLEFRCQVQEVTSERPEGNLYKESDADKEWRVWLKLSNGVVYGCDVIISAIGVQPNTFMLPTEVKRAQDGGVDVDLAFQSSVPDIYAIGDCCTAVQRVEQGKQDPTSEHWFQMRLWTQARIQGTFVAHVMLGLADELAYGFNFELFTHVTRFFGLKVVFLGRYNGQGLDDLDEKDIIMYSRVMDDTFVRVLMVHGKMQGAVLIGDTDLEETFENLILDRLDLSAYGPNILDPEVELDHYFD